MREGVLLFGRRSPRCSLSFLMIVVAALSVVFDLARPFTTPAHIRAAETVLRKYGPVSDPGFDLGDYRAETVERIPNHPMGIAWHVRFVRVAGKGRPEENVYVHEKTVWRFRFNPWASIDRTPAEPPPGAFAPPGPVPARPYGAVPAQAEMRGKTN